MELLSETRSLELLRALGSVIDQGLIATVRCQRDERTDGTRGVNRDARCQLRRRLEMATRRDDLVDEADAMRLLRRDLLARE